MSKLYKKVTRTVWDVMLVAEMVGGTYRFLNSLAREVQCLEGADKVAMKYKGPHKVVIQRVQQVDYVEVEEWRVAHEYVREHPMKARTWLERVEDEYTQQM
jgi:hypothetical protein